MVKLARGPRRPSGPGRQEPVPLFPPGDLPVFGPPPANLRRPMPPPRGLGHIPGGFAPPMARPHIPPPPPPPPHHMRPPMHHLAPPHFPPVHRRPGPPPPPPPLRPLLQTPVLPPRPLPFMRGGGGRGPVHMGRGHGGPVKRLGKSMKKSKNKKNKSKDQKNDGEYYCDVCDRGWETSEELSEHLASHVTCGIDECCFTAHPNVVNLHVKLQHASGLYDKIVRTYDKDEIDKWITERKRNYPSKENIDRKQAIQNEMEERGERIHTNIKSQPVNSDKKRALKEKLYCKEKRLRKRSVKNKILYFPVIEESSKNEIAVCLETVSDTDIAEVNNEDSNQNGNMSEGRFSDDEWKPSSPQLTEVSVSSALSALVSMYGSCDSSQSEGENDEKIEDSSKKFDALSTIDKNVPDLKNDPCVESYTKHTPNNEEISLDKNDDAPDEVVGNKTEDHTPNFFVSSSESPKKNRGYKKKLKQRLRDHKEKNKLTTPFKRKTVEQTTNRNKYFNLLEKLLKNEIKHERNYILQCIRYVVKNNFFY